MAQYSNDELFRFSGKSPSIMEVATGGGGKSVAKANGATGSAATAAGAGRSTGAAGPSAAIAAAPKVFIPVHMEPEDDDDDGTAIDEHRTPRGSVSSATVLASAAAAAASCAAGARGFSSPESSESGQEYSDAASTSVLSADIASIGAQDTAAAAAKNHKRGVSSKLGFNNTRGTEVCVCVCVCVCVFPFSNWQRLRYPLTNEQTSVAREPRRAWTAF